MGFESVQISYLWSETCVRIRSGETLDLPKLLGCPVLGKPHTTFVSLRCLQTAKNWRSKPLFLARILTLLQKMSNAFFSFRAPERSQGYPRLPWSCWRHRSAGFCSRALLRFQHYPIFICYQNRPSNLTCRCNYQS